MSDLEHFSLEDTRVTRRYFAKFDRITGHLVRVAATMEAEGRLSRQDVEVLARYLVGLSLTFRALAHKYHFAGRYPHAGSLSFDRVDVIKSLVAGNQNDPGGDGVRRYRHIHGGKRLSGLFRAADHGQ